MDDDPEIVAMATVATALTGLDADTQGRVLRWAAERYGVTVLTNKHTNIGQRSSDVGNDPGGDRKATPAEDSTPFEHFAELFAKAQPKSDANKALVAAYWVQVHEGQSQWQSRRLNNELKHLGHSVANISKALSAHIDKKPQLVIQLKKSGSSRQATKTYKLTGEGVLFVQGMLSGGNA